MSISCIIDILVVVNETNKNQIFDPCKRFEYFSIKKYYNL